MRSRFLFIFFALFWRFAINDGGVLLSQGVDSLAITVTNPVVWDALKSDESYVCIANEFHIIRPYDINWGESFEPGKLLISGLPNSTVLLTFDFPDTLVGTAAGNITVTYGDSSIGVADPGTSVVHAFHDPHSPLSLVLDSGGRRQVYVAGNVLVSIDATEGDTFLGQGRITAEYTDSALVDSLNGSGIRASAELPFAATRAAADGALDVNRSFPAPRWAALRPSVRYACTIDTISSIQPLDPDNPETFAPCFLSITGAAGVQVKLTLTLPAKLLSKTGQGWVKLAYDSASAMLESGGTYGWFDPSKPAVFLLSDWGAAFVVLGASLVVSSDVNDLDTLTGAGVAEVQYIGMEKEGTPQGMLQHSTRSLLFEAIIASSISLAQNYPNPFNPSTAIDYWLPHSAHVRLAVYDVLGREVAVLADEEMAEGAHTVLWNGVNQPSGVYFYRLVAGKSQKTNKLVIMR